MGHRKSDNINLIIIITGDFFGNHWQMKPCNCDHYGRGHRKSDNIKRMIIRLIIRLLISYYINRDYINGIH